MNEKIVIGLISHFFNDSNLGCTALSICNVVMLDKVAREIGVRIEYKILCNEKQQQIPLSFTHSRYEYRVYPSTKQAVKHPLKTIFTKVFEDCDLVFNLCAGDGFTDIYGKWRTFSESYMTILGKHKGYTMILAPQTIGPFNNVFCKALAKYMMNGCSHIFVRDHLSYELCCKMGQKEKTTEVIDVALALPYVKLEQLHDKVNIGINVSGLLYNGSSNRFGLTINYKEFVHRCVQTMVDTGARVHLISHVLIPNGEGEDDYAACCAVHELFPDTVIAPKYNSPIEVKGYIAGMDLFSGARMHATIAAISSGTPVIPVAYSRKVNGLYGNLQYPYFIDAKSKDMTTDKALEKFISYVNNKDKLKDSLTNSKRIFDEKLFEYEQALKSILLMKNGEQKWKN